MKHLKVHVKLIILMFILLLNCKNKINNQNIEETVNSKEIIHDINQSEKCFFTKDILDSYLINLESKYKKTPNILKTELANRATNFENEIVGIIASVFESEFEVIVDYDIDKKNCKSIVHYNTNVTFENEGELYNIESSTIFELEIIDGKIKITSITMAG